MRAVIFGTSNGIISKGYTRTIKERFERFENRSLGASPSLLVHVRSEGFELRDADTVIVETLTNDVAIPRAGGMTVDLVAQGINSALDHLLSTGATIGGLLLPPKWRDPTYEAVRTIHREAYENRGLQFVDADDFIYDKDRDHCFDDGAHISAALANFLADVLLRKIAASAKPSSADRAASQIVYRPVDSTERVTTTLLDVPISRITKAPIELSAPHAEARLIGLVVNRGDTSCDIRLQGDNSATKRLRFTNSVGNHVVVVPLLTPITPRDGVIGVSMIDTEGDEPSYQADAPESLGTLGLCGAVFET